MTLDSHRINPSSSTVGTNQLGVIAIYSGSWVPANSPPTTICCGDRSSSRQHHSTFWTLIELGRPKPSWILYLPNKPALSVSQRYDAADSRACVP